MFNTILVRPNDHRQHTLDFGQVIENLFFYEKIILHIGRPQIGTLFKLADVDVLEELLSLNSLEVFYNNSLTGIADHGNVFTVDSYSLSDLDVEKELYEQSSLISSDVMKCKRFSRKLARLIKVHKLPKQFNLTLINQLMDDDFRNKVLFETIRFYHPDKISEFENIRFDLEFTDDLHFKINTNFDEFGFKEECMNEQSPILALINGCEDLQVMSQNNAEVSLPDFNGRILRLKVNSVIERGIKLEKEIEVFTHFTFDKAWALRDAINSKRLHVKAALNVLKKANQYKSWLHNLEDDSNLINEYVQKVGEKTIFESLPSKSLRFYVTNGIGALISTMEPALGIATTLGLNAFDSLIFDNLTKKWKPNQFIENELRPLVNLKRI